MNENTRYRVYNKCRYDIGVTMLNGISIVIKAGSFQMLSADDILYIESICAKRKFFGEKMLVACDNAGKEIPLEQIGVYEAEDGVKHYSDEEIEANLKMTAKKLETWISAIDDPAELHAVYETAMKMDLPQSKINILSKHIPDKIWIETE